MCEYNISFNKKQSNSSNSPNSSYNNINIANINSDDINWQHKNQSKYSSMKEEDILSLDEQFHIVKPPKQPKQFDTKCILEKQDKLENFCELVICQNEEKTLFLFGEKITKHNQYDDQDDNVDEIIEAENGDEYVLEMNHRQKTECNPIYLCNELKLRYRIESYNTNDENSYNKFTPEDDSNIQQILKQNLKDQHQKLKRSINSRSNSS